MPAAALDYLAGWEERGLRKNGSDRHNTCRRLRNVTRAGTRPAVGTGYRPEESRNSAVRI